jgi:hypothetical protein
MQDDTASEKAVLLDGAAKVGSGNAAPAYNLAIGSSVKVSS